MYSILNDSLTCMENIIFMANLTHPMTVVEVTSSACFGIYSIFAIICAWTIIFFPRLENVKDRSTVN